MAELHAEKSVCITGAAQSEVGRPSTRSALQLTLDACHAAVAQAGLTMDQIDGIGTYLGKMPGGGGIGPVGTAETAFALGIKPHYVITSGDGHSHLGPVFAAIMAIANGLARHVLIFRTVAQASARAASRQSTLLSGGQNSQGGRVEGNNAWSVPFGAVSPINTFALFAQAYFDKYGATSEQLGWIAVNGRRRAIQNPQAVFRKPLSLDDYLASRVISSPLRLFDCDSHIDGATAILLSHKDAAKDLKTLPLHIESIGMSMSGFGAGVFARDSGDDFTGWAADRTGEVLWSRTDLAQRDVDCAQIYDGFSIHTLLWLESLGFAPKGEAARFVDGGTRIDLDGELPLNTGGGQLSAGRFHGYGHIHEACVQLWGQGGERQVRNAKTSLVACGGYGFGAMLLRRD
ncbi:MAG: thiolase family protein [Novosphingobium sp.]